MVCTLGRISFICLLSWLSPFSSYSLASFQYPRPPQFVVVGVFSDSDIFAELQSNGSKASGWPQKDPQGVWLWEPSFIKIAGTGKVARSIDSSFYTAQSQGAEDLIHREAYRKQMRDSYLNQFQLHYDGSRAPIFIAHHLRPLQGGAYQDALKDFTRTVCRLSEVRCVSFPQFFRWLEDLPEQELNDYRSNSFEPPSSPTPRFKTSMRALDLHLQIYKSGEELRISAGGADFSEDLMRLVVKINGKAVPLKTLRLPLLRHHFQLGANLEISASLFDRKGLEIQRATYLLKNLGTDQEIFLQKPAEMGATGEAS